MRTRLTMMVALAGALVACSDPVTSEVPLPADVLAVVVGTYNLQSWKGLALPAKHSGSGMSCTPSGCAPNGTEVFIVAGSVSLDDNQTYTRVTTWRETRPGQPNTEWTQSSTGTFSGSAAGGPITLNFAPLTMSGSLSGNTLALTLVGEAWTYAK